MRGGPRREFSGKRKQAVRRRDARIGMDERPGVCSPGVLTGGGDGGHQMDHQGARVRQLQLLLRLPLPIQRSADAWTLSGGRRLRDRPRPARLDQARRPEVRRNLPLAGRDPRGQGRGRGGDRRARNASRSARRCCASSPVRTPSPARPSSTCSPPPSRSSTIRSSRP